MFSLRKSCSTLSPVLQIVFLAALFVSMAAFKPDIFLAKLSDAALSLTKDRVVYDARYFVIKYPNGDVPAGRGVCTDVIIRSYRKLGKDLQKLVHEDMRKNFKKYPQLWDLRGSDANIDHRRVPNLMTFFARFGKVLKISDNPRDFRPGEIVTWDLGKGITHIGIVVNRTSLDKKRYLIVHNIGRGQELSDCLFSYNVIGHCRYE